MPCDKYKNALIEAAASGVVLANVLREHVNTCAHCASILAGERTLFAAVDAELRKAANAKVRSSFVAGVKANLATETVPTRNPIPGWAFVCATGALALAAAFLSLPRAAHDKTRTETTVVASKVPTGAGGELGLAPERKTHYAARAFKALERQNVSTRSHEPEVLIQPEEEEFLKRFFAAARNPARDVRAIVTDEHEIVPKPQVIARIEVKDLRIDNLDDESGFAQTGTK
jgi:hypothetical protein